MVYKFSVWIALALMFLSGAQVYAQRWFKGDVALKNGKVLSGEVSYEPGREEILLRPRKDDPTMVFPGFRISSFSILEKESGIMRNFVVLPHDNGITKRHRFYEVMTEGRISILRQEQDEWYSNRQGSTAYEYFVIKDGVLMTLRDFRKNVFTSIKNSTSDLHDYAKRNRISPSDIHDVVQFARYYNKTSSELTSVR